MSRELLVDRAQLALVQDLGRFGHGAIGVPYSGAADLGAHRLANRLVGNAESLATLELIGGLRVTATADLVIAITGPEVEVRIDGRRVGRNRAVPLRSGSTADVGVPADGLRNQLAVAGGIDVSPVLGSRSTDMLAGLGPKPIRAGDRLPVGTDPGLRPAVDVVVVPHQQGPVPLLDGPRSDWLTMASLNRLFDAHWSVTELSNRVGLRLAGPELAWESPGRELPSEGLVRGAVQVPPNGQPIVFLADHPVTGGYPVVAVVAATHLDRLAQLRPGDPLRFTRHDHR